MYGDNMINTYELESWAQRAAEALQEFVDEAQEASGNPDAEDQLMDIRELLQEHNQIMAGQMPWQAQLATDDGSSTINFGDD